MSIMMRRLLSLTMIVGLTILITDAMAADCSCNALKAQTPGAYDTGINGGITATASQTQTVPQITQSGFCPAHGYVCTSIPASFVAEQSPNALFDQLRQQHRQVASLMQQVLDANSVNRPDAYNQFRMALIPHLKAEEATLYQAMEGSNRTHMVALRSEEEHHAAANVLGELEATPFGSDRWLARFVVLRDMIVRHIGEEEGRVFPAVRSAFNRQQLGMLYTQFNNQEQQIASALEPAPTTASFLTPSDANGPTRYDYSTPTYSVSPNGAPTTSLDQHMGYDRWDNFNSPLNTNFNRPNP